MTEHLTKRFVHHGGIGLAPQRVAEFPFHHGERGFDIGTLVVVLQKFLPFVHEKVVHLLKQTASPASAGVLVCDEGGTANSGNGLGIFPATVSLIGRDFGDCEIKRRGFDPSRASLRRDDPNPLLAFGNRPRCRQFHSALLPCVHNVTSLYEKYITSRYI